MHGIKYTRLIGLDIFDEGAVSYLKPFLFHLNQIEMSVILM